jgi:hypothetical protein
MIFHDYKKYSGIPQGVPTVPVDFGTNQPASPPPPCTTAFLLFPRDLELEALPRQCAPEVF